MAEPIQFDNLIPAVSCDNLTYETVFDDQQVVDKSLNSIYVVGSNVFGLGLLNAIHVLLAFVANGTTPEQAKFTILDPGQSDYNDILGSPFLNGDIITNNDDILTILETSAELEFDFQNILVLNHYDWLKNSSNRDYSAKIIKAVEKLVNKAAKNNVIFIVVDRNISNNEKIPNFDAILCFQLPNENLSKIILGQPGAEKLGDHGDSLYLNRKTGEIKRGQIPLLSDELFTKILRLN